MSNDEQSDDLADKGWQAGTTFFEASGGRPAKAAGGDDHMPTSESDTGLIPEDEGQSGGDVHLPASEEDTGGFTDEGRGEPQSWPGSGGPGTFPPPG